MLQTISFKGVLLWHVRRGLSTIMKALGMLIVLLSPILLAALAWLVRKLAALL